MNKQLPPIPPIKKRSKWFRFLVIFGLCIVWAILINILEGPKSPIQKDIKKTAPKQRTWQDDQFSSWDGSHRKTVRYVKNLMHNPKSFEHVETTYKDSASQGFRVIYMVYRGTNPFNAIITDSIWVKVDLTGEVTEVLSPSEVTEILSEEN